MALFMSAIPISGLLGSPFSGWILNTFSSGTGGLAGWQWLYLLQGTPTILLGIGMFFLLNDGIDEAKWLDEKERVRLKNALIEDEKNRPLEVSDSFSRVLRNPSVVASLTSGRRRGLNNLLRVPCLLDGPGDCSLAFFQSLIDRQLTG